MMPEPIKDRSIEVLYKFASQALKEGHVESWFARPNSLLGGKSPIEKVLEGNDGWDRVEQLIASMIYGFPS